MNVNALRKHSLRILALALLLTLGCSSKDQRVDLKGKVTLDGQPMDRGHIAFVPEDGTGSAAGAEIVNGEYEVKLAPGQKRVKVTKHQEAVEEGPGAREERKSRTREIKQNRKEQGQAPMVSFVGNDQVREVKADTGTLDIELKTPGRR